MKWFNNPATLEELKKQYKALALKYHPDRGGNLKDMQDINAEYDTLFISLKNVHQTADGNTYEAKTDSTETASDFKEIITQLIILEGVQIEICGSWLWVTGNTYQHKAVLKSLKFRYSKSKCAWYYHNDGYRKTNGKTFTLEQIRSLYGSEVVNSKPTLKLQVV